MGKIPPVPVHVLTGFLGSGKTTLLNAILKEDAFANSAVIINEFGEIGLDHHLVETADDSIIELSNGCLCCTVRGQLVETIETLLERQPERILIETTGLADPVPVLEALTVSPAIKDAIDFGGLFTVVDCLQGFEKISRHTEANRQVRLADKIIVSKLDTLETVNPDSAYAELADALVKLAPASTVISKEEFLSSLHKQFTNSAATLSMSLARDNEYNDSSNQSPQTAHHHNVNRHNASISAKLLTHHTPLELYQIEMFLDLLLSAHGRHILRLKGLVNIAGSDRPMLIQSVGRALSEPVFLKQWPDENRSTRIVVFLENMSGDFVENLFSGFLNSPAIDTPDREALTQNPLAIPGYKSR